MPRVIQRCLGPAVFGMALASGGCAGSAGDHQRLLDELQRAQVRALESQVRMAELERRLAEMEQTPAVRADAVLARELMALGDKLDLLVSQTQVLLNREAAPAGAHEAAPGSRASEEEAGDAAADPLERLRYWAERVRADSTRWRGGLSPAQNEALNVILRRERSLDPANPWLAR